MSVPWSVIAHTQGATWTLVHGLPTRAAAAAALTAIITRDGLRAADGSGRMVPVTMTVDQVDGASHDDRGPGGAVSGHRLPAAVDAIVDLIEREDGTYRAVDYAPDSADYGGSTEPGSAWYEECDRLLAEVQAALPAGWSASWSDDDLVVYPPEHCGCADRLDAGVEDLVRASARAASDAPMHSASTEGYEASLLAALEWAADAIDGDYLVQYEDTGLTDAQDPGSRCGYSDAEFVQIQRALAARDLRLAADDRGLVAQAVRP